MHDYNEPDYCDILVSECRLSLRIRRFRCAMFMYLVNQEGDEWEWYCGGYVLVSAGSAGSWAVCAMS